MKLSTRVQGDVAILEVSGSVLGGSDAQTFSDEIHNLIDQGVVNVVADLSKVSRMNSSGLGILISNYTTLKNRNGNLKLANVNKLMKGILVLTKLDSVFENYETVERAIHSF
ncbi:STAS domain-containing protein [candidate division KSB1 bacterium]|nr:STAS domain-containing protein [candidate division KSB1 bacterium]